MFASKWGRKRNSAKVPCLGQWKTEPKDALKMARGGNCSAVLWVSQLKRRRTTAVSRRLGRGGRPGDSLQN